MKRWKRVIIALLVLIILGAGGIFGINAYVVNSNEDRILCSVDSTWTWDLHYSSHLRSKQINF